MESDIPALRFRLFHISIEKMKRLLPLFLFFLSFHVIATDEGLRHVHLDLNNLPNKVLVIAPDIDVKELSVGGVSEPVEDWSNQARANVKAALDSQLSAQPLFEKLSLPTNMTLVETDNLDEHVALYDLVAGSAFQFANGISPAWKHKKDSFDYTIGPGLSGLVEKTGAEAALIIVGEDYISSSGRKAARVFAALMGIGLPGAGTFLTAGLVDLHTGDLLWMNYDIRIDTIDLRDPEDAKAMFDDLMRSFPGRIKQ